MHSGKKHIHEHTNVKILLVSNFAIVFLFKYGPPTKNRVCFPQPTSNFAIAFVNPEVHP